MDSLPQRQESQSQPRRSSPEESQAPSASSRHTASPVRSEDSQTLFVHTPEEEDEGNQEADAHAAQTPGPFLNIDDDPNVKKCWICFSDSTEDTPGSSPWRDPCPCALVAHEACLLDWIADTESPKNVRTKKPKLECPQCKSEIKLSRPTDYVVKAVQSLERFGTKLIIPTAGCILSGIVLNSSAVWGMHSVYAIFGRDDGFRILAPILENVTRPPVEVYVGAPAEASRQIAMVMASRLVHWRLYAGLPLITPILILSRTKLADGLLPVLPMIFFAGLTSPHLGSINFGQWPPSAGLVFAALPYVRSAYNFYYQIVWAEKEEQWLKEIQPRNNQNDNENIEDLNAQQGGAQPQEAEGENIFEVRIDGNIFEDWNGNGDPPPQQEQQQPEAAPAAAPPPNVPRARQQPGPNAFPHQQRPDDGAAPAAAAAAERRVSFSPLGIAETVLGALLFPTIAGLSGELLKAILPAAWTAPPVVSWRFGSKLSPRTLLQQKWGRSIIGGCLFVVAKDAVMLYVRWKMAQMHRNRKVVDYKKDDRRA